MKIGFYTLRPACLVIQALVEEDYLHTGVRVFFGVTRERKLNWTPIYVQVHLHHLVRWVIQHGAHFVDFGPPLEEAGQVDRYVTRFFRVETHSDAHGHVWDNLYLRLPGNRQHFLYWEC